MESALSGQTPARQSGRDTPTVDEQLFDAARKCDVRTLRALLDAHPDKLRIRNEPYEWTLLHAAAHEGCLAAVDLLLARGLDVNVREKGDNTYAMHWAAAAAHLDVVRRLADAGGDVVGRGDDHELEVIGWASAWDGCDDAAHRAVVDFLISRGARHHIYSAIATNDADAVRKVVAADPAALNRRMSRNENNQTPLHFAVRMNRPAMIALLLELGADPLTVDGEGQPVASYASGKDVDHAVMEAIRAMTRSELASADRGKRKARGSAMDLVACLTLGDWAMAARLVRDNPELLKRGALHLLAKRDDGGAVQWMLDHGAEPNARLALADAEVTPLHMAIWGDSPGTVRLLLAAGADPRVRDTRHDSDAMGWAEFFKRAEIQRILEDYAGRA
jgi:ankyrin repeat protein